MQSIESKQTLLREEVLQSGLDAQQFIQYIGKIKGQGDNVDLENWSIKELRDAITLFKDEINKSKIMVMSSRISLRDNKKSKIFDNTKKEKVIYENSCLWDFQLIEQQECQKAEILIKIPQNDEPRVTVQKAQIKSVGGFIFGLGARNELQVTISTNFTPNRILRKGEDVDWLKSILTTYFPGWYVPPLQTQRELNTDDKKGIATRKNQIQVFLNKVVKYSIFQTSQQLKVFFQEQNIKKFHQYKSRESSFDLQRDTQRVSTLSGKLHIQISDKMNKNLKYSSQIATEINSLYADFNSCFGKIIGEIERIEKYSKNLSEITAKLSQKYGQAQKLLKIQLKMPTMFLSFNNISANVTKNIRRHVKAMNDLNENYIRQTSKDWNEFIVNENKVQKQLKRYLCQKQIMIRKKQRYVGDITRWQLPQSDYLQFKNKDLSKMSRDEKFTKMFPSQNQSQMRYRIWLAHVNHNFLQGFRIFLLQQQKSLINSYMQYSGEATCLNAELINNFNQFNQMIFQ